MIRTGRARILGLAIAVLVTTSALAAAPDLILVNGRILPMTTPDAVHGAIAIAGDRIVAIGGGDEILALADAETETIDLAGAVVLPGFIDPHTHLLNDSWNRGLSPADALRLALRHGITSAANMYTTPELVDEAVAMAERGEMLVRMSLYLIHNTSCGEVIGPWYEAYDPLTEIAPNVRIGGVKIFSETSVCGDDLIGISFSPALASRLSPGGTAWYGENRPLFTAQELAAVVRRASDNGFPVAIHAIGEWGVQVSLAAIVEAVGDGPNELRHMILHNLFVRDDLLPIYAERGIVAAVESVNACFVDFYDDLLPAEYAGIARRWRDLVDTGAHVVADSDWPWCADEALDPLFRLQALLVPENLSASYEAWEPCSPLPESQLLTAWEGLRMMTIEAAYALHRDDNLGTLESGKLADLVVLSDDPLRIDPRSLTDIEVLMTIVGGRVAWRRD